MGMSLPMRAAILMAVSLLVCAILYCVWVIWFSGGGEGMAGLWTRSDKYMVAALLLFIGLPTAIYYATKVWLEVEPTKFPDIDAAWNAGLAALAKSGVDLTETPLFLAIGVNDPNSADAIMHGSGWELIVDGQPQGKTPLKFYASRDAVLIHCVDASGIGICHVQNLVGAAGVDPTKTLVNLSGDSSAPRGPSPRAAVGLRGTMIADEEPEPQPAAMSQRPSSISGTMILSGPNESVGGGAVAPSVATVDRSQLTLQHDRLARVCQLVRSIRQPYCPINGVLAVVSWRLLCGPRVDWHLPPCVRISLPSTEEPDSLLPGRSRLRDGRRIGVYGIDPEGRRGTSR